MNNFSEQLKILRSEHGLTQKQLGEATGLSARGIQDYELEQRKPGLDVLIALADYFDVSIDYLVGRSAYPIILDRIGDVPEDEADSQSER